MPAKNSLYLEFFERLKNRHRIIVHAFGLHPFRVLPDSHEQIMINRERIAKTAEDLKIIPWKDVTWGLSGGEKSEDELFYLTAQSSRIQYGLTLQQASGEIHYTCLV